MILKLNINPSHRNFFKKIRGILIVSALALVVFSPTKLQAQENKNKADKEPPKLSEKELSKITDKSELSPDRIKKLKEIVRDLLNKEKYSTSSKNYGPGYDGAWGVEDGEIVSIHGSIPTAFTKKEFKSVSAFYSVENYRTPFYDRLPEFFEGKNPTELEDIQESYVKFMYQVRATQIMINEEFFSYETDPDRDVLAAYNRVIGIGIVEGLIPGEFKKALEDILPEVLARQGLSSEIPQGGYEEIYNKLSKDGQRFFYDEDGQQGNIDFFIRAIRNNKAHERGYTGENGIKKSPLERAEELYPNDKLKQIIYALNIITAALFYDAQDGLENGDVTNLNSNIAQGMSGIFNKVFSPRTRK
jgi:hypothetical protein